MATRNPPPKRTFHAQQLYLEPEKAELLASLATTTRVPRAVLLREAVDDMLSKHGVEVEPSVWSDTRAALDDARSVIVRYKIEARGWLWQKRCDDAIARIDQVLKQIS